MATYRKRGNSWRVEVAKLGVRHSATFDTKAQAVSWAVKIEAEILHGKPGYATGNRTLAQALDRYQHEVSSTKAGERWEIIRITKLKRELDFVGNLINEVSSDQIGQWRDLRLKEVAGSTVNRELNLLSAVFETARREWKWCGVNPVREVRRPKNPQPRDRRISSEEIAAMAQALGYDAECAPANMTQRIALAFLFALETAMRAGEIVSLRWDRVFFEKQYLRLDQTKNGDARNVPLSKEAVRLLHVLPREHDVCFGVSSASLDALWRKARDKAAQKMPAIKELHFHGSRHEAITRLARKLDVLDLARMIGHRDPRSLMIYYNATASDIAARLD